MNKVIYDNNKYLSQVTVECACVASCTYLTFMKDKEKWTVRSLSIQNKKAQYLDITKNEMKEIISVLQSLKAEKLETSKLSFPLQNKAVVEITKSGKQIFIDFFKNEKRKKCLFGAVLTATQSTNFIKELITLDNSENSMEN